METHVDKLVKSKLKKIKEEKNIFNVGKVTKVKEYVIEVSGLEDVMFFEKVSIWEKGMGYINGIQENTVTVALVKIYDKIQVGDTVNSSGELFKAIYSEDAIGRITDIFGEDKLLGKVFKNTNFIEIERPNVPIMDRTSVNRPMFTGVSGIDLIYPIGRGQRQLIIGDKKTGKTQIALDTIVNQGRIMDNNENPIICIYVAVGKTKREIKTIYKELESRGAMRYTMMLVATNEDMPPILSLIPYVGMSIAQEYMFKGYDVVVVIDDLKRHAEIYREIGLITGKVPGREAYPADIFFAHARLLEKGCQHKDGGSITVLPIVETKGGDITDYISTNIISITDGQIVLSQNQFNKGLKPAIDYTISVSRLGGAVQTDEVKKIGARVRRELLSYLDTKEVYELANIDEMSDELKNKMKHGKKLENALIQNKYSPISSDEIIRKFELIGEE